MTEPTSPQPHILDKETITNDPSKSSLPPLLQDHQPEAWDNFPWSKFPGYIKAT